MSDIILSQKEILALNHAGLYEPIELTAMSTVFSDRNLGISIQINADENRRGLAYFKLYNSFQYSKAAKVARISFRVPQYVIHRNTDGKQNWFLNNKERKLLMTALQLKPVYFSHGFTVWQKLIIQYNSEKFQLMEDDTMSCTRANYNQFIKNYTALGYENLVDVLPFDLPMPNYLLLKE